MPLRLALLVVLLALPLPAAAQIVNVQSLVGKAVEPGLSGQAALSLDWSAGNTQLLAGSASATTFYKRGDDIALLTVSGAYGLKGKAGRFDEDPYQEKIFEHLRWRHALGAVWSTEAFGQHEYDRYRRLKFRALAGAGVRREVAVSQALAFAFGLAYMAQWEELLQPKAGDPTGAVQEHRLSSYASGGWKITDDVGLSATVYAQPNLTDLEDLRGLVDAALTVTLSKALQLKLIHGLSYDTRPPRQVRGYDAATKVALAATY